MIKRYEEIADHPYKMKANRELMMLQKVLLRDAYKTEEMGDLQINYPLDQCRGIKRIEVYDDELKFEVNRADPKSEPRIDKVAMSSEPHRNFFLIGMNGIV